MTAPRAEGSKCQIEWPPHQALFSPSVNKIVRLFESALSNVSGAQVLEERLDREASSMCQGLEQAMFALHICTQ